MNFLDAIGLGLFMGFLLLLLAYAEPIEQMIILWKAGQ